MARFDMFTGKIESEIVMYRILAEKADDLASAAMGRGETGVARCYEAQAGRYYEAARRLEAGDKR